MKMDRDKIAIRAMQGMLSSREYIPSKELIEDIALAAYKLADKMIERGEKK